MGHSVFQNVMLPRLCRGGIPAYDSNRVTKPSVDLDGPSSTLIEPAAGLISPVLRDLARQLKADAGGGIGHAGYAQTKPLEPALEQVLNDLAWSEHLVLTTPMCWGGLLAKLTGLIDRAFLQGRAFNPRKITLFGTPAPLWAGRSARVVFTSDTPGWFLRLVYRNALIWQLGGQVLGFVGFKSIRFTQLGPASRPRAGEVGRWIEKVRQLGAAVA